jgi:3-hydroxyacyl-[acyl-carrier-protein] dehydratase
MTSKHISNQEIRERIPHRYPFLLIDTVIDWEAGKSLVGLKNVTTNEPFFSGHFPVRPVMPGVLIVEALAQACGMLLIKTLPDEDTLRNLFYLTGVDNARFKRMVVPGDQLMLHVEVLKNRREVWKFNVVAKVGDEVACSAEITIVRDANPVQGGVVAGA